MSESICSVIVHITATAAAAEMFTSHAIHV